jgi:hypothetical protein
LLHFVKKYAIYILISFKAYNMTSNFVYMNNKYIDTIHKFISPKNKLKTYICAWLHVSLHTHIYG